MSVASLANKSITVQRSTDTAGAFGGKAESWANHLKLQARVQPISGSENFRYNRDLEAVLVNMYVPGAPDVTHKDRVQFRSKTYKIIAVMNTDEVDVFLKIVCELQQ